MDAVCLHEDQASRTICLPEPASRFVACIVVPGLEPGDVWSEALAKAGADASLSIAFPEQGDILSGDGVVVVSQPNAAFPFNPADWALLPPDVDRVLVDQGTVALSRILALAYDGIPTGATLVQREYLKSVAQFTLFGRLDVDVPDPLRKSGASVAGQEFLVTYAGGPPALAVRTTMPLEMFTLDDRHDRSAYELGDLDLTGRARYLLHGSYHWLPRGLWRVTVTLAVDADGGAHTYRVEWGGLSSFSQHAIRPNRPGRYCLTIDHRFEAASPSELRIVLAQGSLGGNLVIENVSLERVSD